jgi:Ribosomal prokaryotic L21 protein
MFRDGDVVTDPGELEKVKVEATVTEHLRGPKIRIFKYKPKKGYRRRAGHRSELTRVEITELRQLSRRPAAKKEGESKQEGTARKPAAKKETSRKSTTRRKTTAKKGSSSGS